ncbi:Contactin-2, partial [Dissostichus eleginoides]
MILGNVQSLRNKVDELQGNVRFQKNFRDCSVLAFTETWLTDCNQDNDLFIDGFGAPFRLDRKAEVTGKTQGGGIIEPSQPWTSSAPRTKERVGQ